MLAAAPLHMQTRTPAKTGDGPGSEQHSCDPIVCEELLTSHSPRRDAVGRRDSATVRRVRIFSVEIKADWCRASQPKLVGRDWKVAPSELPASDLDRDDMRLNLAFNRLRSESRRYCSLADSCCGGQVSAVSPLNFIAQRRPLAIGGCRVERRWGTTAHR